MKTTRQSLPPGTALLWRCTSLFACALGLAGCAAGGSGDDPTLFETGGTDQTGSGGSSATTGTGAQGGTSTSGGTGGAASKADATDATTHREGRERSSVQNRNA